ncbi:MAG: SMP-30/gluconolactonase/LRE family protein [Acidimicrobiales bacterium]
MVVHRLADLVLDARATLGEGPAWDSSVHQLLWVDIDACRVHYFEPIGRHDTFVQLDQHVTAVVPDARGGYLLAVRDGIAHLGPDGGFEIIVDLSRPGLRMNDGKCAPDGAFWAGNMAYDKSTGAGSLYRLGTDGRVSTQLSGITVSNGMAWTPDYRTFYFVDSPTRRIDVFDIQPGTHRLTNRRPLVLLPPGIGNPDGLTIDNSGGVWVALWGGGAVHRYRPDGNLDTVIHLPTAYVTSCCFGGTTGTDLFITTARRSANGRSDRQESAPVVQPEAGGLFRVRLGVSGPPALAYGGGLS